MNTLTADTEFEKIVAEAPGIENRGKIAARLLVLNEMEGLAANIIDTRKLIQEQGGGAMPESLITDMEKYAYYTGLPVLPDEQRYSLRKKLEEEFLKRDAEWRKTGDFKEHKELADFVD